MLVVVVGAGELFANSVKDLSCFLKDHSVVIAQDPEVAKTLFEQNKVGLAFVDYDELETDGINFIEWVRCHGYTGRLFLMSVHADVARDNPHPLSKVCKLLKSSFIQKLYASDTSGIVHYLYEATTARKLMN